MPLKFYHLQKLQLALIFHVRHGEFFIYIYSIYNYFNADIELGGIQCSYSFLLYFIQPLQHVCVQCFLNVLLPALFQLPFHLLSVRIFAAFLYWDHSSLMFLILLPCVFCSLGPTKWKKRFNWNMSVFQHPSDTWNYSPEDCTPQQLLHITTEDGGSCLPMNQRINGWLALGVEQMRSRKPGDGVTKTWGSL